MNELILNDETVAKAITDHEAEIKKLRQSATPVDAKALLPKLDDYDLSKFLPKGTVAGVIRRAKKGGSVQAYGFVNCSSSGDIFVPPSLMSEFNDGERVACMSYTGERGLVADKIAGLETYISWHKDDILRLIMKDIDDRRQDQLKWYGTCDPTNGWDEMKAKCKALGLELLEVRKVTKSVNYGGRGTDSYKFTTAVTHEQAEKILDVLNARHAEPDNGAPYDHGHDNIRISEGMCGFENDWCGPFTD